MCGHCFTVCYVCFIVCCNPAFLAAKSNKGYYYFYVHVVCNCYLCQGEANIGSIEEFGKTVLVTEKRSNSRGSRSGLVIIRVSTNLMKCSLKN